MTEDEILEHLFDKRYGKRMFGDGINIRIRHDNIWLYDGNKPVGVYRREKEYPIDVDFRLGRIQIYEYAQHTHTLKIPKKCTKSNRFCRKVEGWTPVR